MVCRVVEVYVLCLRALDMEVVEKIMAYPFHLQREQAAVEHDGIPGLCFCFDGFEFLAHIAFPNLVGIVDGYAVV